MVNITCKKWFLLQVKIKKWYVLKMLIKSVEQTDQAPSDQMKLTLNYQIPLQKLRSIKSKVRFKKNETTLTMEL